MPRSALLLAALVLSSRAVAQSDSAATHAPNGTIIGVTVGVPGYDRHAIPELAVVGLDIMNTQPSRLGIDFALGTIPKTLSSQAVVLGMRLDAVFPIPVTRDFWVIPAVGGSLVGGAVSGAGDVFPGANVGIGSILWSGPVGIRTSLTAHRFAASSTVWLAEIGVVGGR